MSQPTRQEIINAHEALEDMHHIARKTTEKWDEEGLTDFWKSLILRALPPKPQPTMAEVEWDDEKHYLAEAEHPDHGKVIMLGKGLFSGLIRITRPKEDGPLWQTVGPETLTPTGRRYTLTEVQE